MTRTIVLSGGPADGKTVLLEKPEGQADWNNNIVLESDPPQPDGRLVHYRVVNSHQANFVGWCQRAEKSD